MSQISSLSSNVTTQLISKLSSMSQPSSTADAGGVAIGNDSSQISTLGDLMTQLEERSSSDPDKFKQVTSDIASKLGELASTLSGDETSRVTDLASKFADASDSGKTQALRPSKPPPPPGHPPQGAAAYQQKQTMSIDGGTSEAKSTAFWQTRSWALTSS